MFEPWDRGRWIVKMGKKERTAEPVEERTRQAHRMAHEQAWHLLLLGSLPNRQPDDTEKSHLQGHGHWTAVGSAIISVSSFSLLRCCFCFLSVIVITHEDLNSASFLGNNSIQTRLLLWDATEHLSGIISLPFKAPSGLIYDSLQLSPLSGKERHSYLFYMTHRFCSYLSQVQTIQVTKGICSKTGTLLWTPLKTLWWPVTKKRDWTSNGKWPGLCCFDTWNNAMPIPLIYGRNHSVL